VLARQYVGKGHMLSTCLLAGLLNYFFDPEDGGDVPPKRRLKLNGLHGVISQKMILFKLRYTSINSHMNSLAVHRHGDRTTTEQLIRNINTTRCNKN
jgi:hypothetical protein